VAVWGHPSRKLLVIEVSDPGRVLQGAKVELSEWRSSMRVACAQGGLTAREVQERPARPHLANTGMQDYFDQASDPLLGRGLAVAVSAQGPQASGCTIDGQTAGLALPPNVPSRYAILIAAAVTNAGDPLASAQRELSAALTSPLEGLAAEHQAWWREYWSRSLLSIDSPDGNAERLARAYHVHLYTLGCVNRGQYPGKWDGGPGLLDQDRRQWGLSEWVQEVRFTYWPLYAANRLEMAKGLVNHYSRMTPYLKRQTETMWGIPGLWIPETVLPWGHAEDFVLKLDGKGTPEHYQRWVPGKAPYVKFEAYNPYIGFLFTAGLEVAYHYLTYYRFSGDEGFLRDQAYPVIRGVCEFLAGLVRKETDGRFHLDPANALETWWLVRDPADALAGIRAIFPEFIRLARQFARDDGLRERCQDVLSNLAEPPRGIWTEKGEVLPAPDVYAPAMAVAKNYQRRNAENPALYRAAPFSLSGIDSADRETARLTFARRIAPLGHGWSMDAIWAARLGLAEEACTLAAEHARKFQRFRYGGWTSNDSRAFPDGLSVVPFLDAGGLSAYALQEILLQSHNGVIRVLPAVAKGWSGTFRLRAEGGFLVTASFRNQVADRIEIESLLGKECIIANPWGAKCQVRRGAQVTLSSDAPLLRFKTAKGETYTLARN